MRTAMNANMPAAITIAPLCVHIELSRAVHPDYIPFRTDQSGAILQYTDLKDT